MRSAAVDIFEIEKILVEERGAVCARVGQCGEWVRRQVSERVDAAPVRRRRIIVVEAEVEAIAQVLQNLAVADRGADRLIRAVPIRLRLQLTDGIRTVR